MSFDESSRNIISRRPCTACGDFSAELADISCDGVGLDCCIHSVVGRSTDANLFYDAVKKKLLKIKPVENFQTSTILLVNLSRLKRDCIDSFLRDYKRMKND